MDDLLTIPEVAARLRVRPKTVWAWVKTGRLPGVRVGRLWRVRTSDLEAWLERLDRVEAVPAEPGPPYDWGPGGPPPTRRVRYASGRGWVVEDEPVRALRIGDVTVVRSGRGREGRRPAVVVGLPEAVGRPRFPVVLVAPMTTAFGPWVEAGGPLYTVLEPGEGGLPRRSVVLLDRLRAVDGSRVEGLLGTLSEDRVEAVRQALVRMLGFGGEP